MESPTVRYVESIVYPVEGADFCCSKRKYGVQADRGAPFGVSLVFVFNYLQRAK
jgi:hypothetical protein